MTVTSAEALEQLYGAPATPCVGDHHKDPPPAEWMVKWDRCCPDAAPSALLCTDCLDRIGRMVALACNSCGTTWSPAARAILSGHPI